MGCCMCKKFLNIIAGLVLVAIAMNLFILNVWLVIGLYLFLKGIMPFICSCECCKGACDTKKKR